MRVVCTAGHVDHGKSTLVKALTGMEPDRFAEEQRRGLTIDLGFAWAELGQPPRTVAFVDLPGHERFVGNMLAGAGAVDLALFVVAADEGWMPQSQEHLDILDLLDVHAGVVAITKTDAVDAETAAIAEELVREQLRGTRLEQAAIVPVSAATGAGLETLVRALTDVLDAAPPPRDVGRPRLWVDRSFSVRGAGTVVTGTLAGGSLRAGDDVVVLPTRQRARIRGMQSLKAAVEQAPAGTRVAVNLAGVEREDVRRGHAIGHDEQWLAVHRFDAQIRTLRDQRIGRRGAWHVHVGAAESGARVVPLLTRPVEPDDTAMIRVELAEPLPLCAGDRFVLREAGRRATVAGGVVLDPDPAPGPRGAAARRRRVRDLEERARRIAARDHAALLALHVAERGWEEASRAAAAVGLSREDAERAAREHALLTVAGAWVDPRAQQAWTRAVLAALAAHHRAHPLERVAPKDVAARAAAAAECPGELVAALLDKLVGAGVVVGEGPGLRTPEHQVRLEPAEAAARDALLAALADHPFAPPRLPDAAARAGASPALVRELEASGAVVRIAPDVVMTTSAVDAAVEVLRAAYLAEGPLTAARAKEVLGTTRKYALPLLEHLDRCGRTRRRGDVREIVG